MWKGIKYNPYKITHLDRNSHDRVVRRMFMLVLILLTLTAIILTSFLFVKRQYSWGSVTFIVLTGLIPVVVMGYGHYLNKQVYKVKECRKLFDMVPVEDTSVMDRWYKNGGIVINNFESKFLDLYYNWLRDTGLISSGNVTLYTFTRKEFISRYPFHDGTGINGDKFAMLPIKDLSGDMDTLKGLWKSHGYFYRYTDFNSMVNGTYSIRECGLQHRFKDKIDNFISFG